MKRLMDILVSAVLLLLSLPITLPICVILCFVGEKRVFFKQERIGHGGKPFNLLKFTTMLDSVVNRPDAGLVVDSDPEVFWLGKILRKTKLNEVPQLLNVFIGDMSLVGPRPLTRKSFNRYATDVQRVIVQTRPGLTGIGSIVFRNEADMLASSHKSREQCYVEDILPYKGELEKWYVSHSSFWCDIQLLLLTAQVVVVPKTKLPQRILDNLPQPPAALDRLLGT